MEPKKLYGGEEAWVIGVTNKMRRVYQATLRGSELPGQVVTYRDMCIRFKTWDPMTVLYCLVALHQLGLVSKGDQRGYAGNANSPGLVAPRSRWAAEYKQVKDGFDNGDYEAEDWTAERFDD